MDCVPTPAAPVTLIHGYAHEDEALRNELQGRLKRLERRRLPVPWHDHQTVVGQAWAGRRNENMRQAEFAPLLVSQDSSSPARV